jgi:hypothetical protein
LEQLNTTIQTLELEKKTHMLIRSIIIPFAEDGMAP